MTPVFIRAHDFWTRFWREMDASDYDAVLARLTTDCRWLRGRECTGHEDILRSLCERPAGLFSRHIVTNLTVDEAGDEWLCRFDLLSFGHVPTGPDDRPPYRTTGPRLIAYEATLVAAEIPVRASSLRMEFLFERTQATV